MRIADIEMRLENEKDVERSQKKTREMKHIVIAREKRDARLLKVKREVVPTMEGNWSQIDDFRKNVSDFKSDTVELSKKFIIELEEAAKRDRIAWMQQCREYE